MKLWSIQNFERSLGDLPCCSTRREEELVARRGINAEQIKKGRQKWLVNAKTTIKPLNESRTQAISHYFNSEVCTDVKNTTQTEQKGEKAPSIDIPAFRDG